MFGAILNAFTLGRDGGVVKAGYVAEGGRADNAEQKAVRLNVTVRSIALPTTRFW